MRCAFLNKNYSESVIYAKSVLDNNAITQPIKIEAEYASGMANYYLNNSADAITSLIWISKNTNSVLAAEARYTLAAIYFKENENSKAETEINAILKMKPSYDYWVAKGLMLQSKIQISKEDYVQAEQNIQSIIDFYPKNLNDGILLEANELYNEIIQLQNPSKDLEDTPEKTIEIKQD
jgi:tetratricopeptide (TPR) repeat protein